ncbi:hypothetical protein [Clostridium gasigenes]|uniref:Uncharacterized protein n=1 Tax=Clostridium gasigenes TaxID=94869 RepID=A0A7X0SF97_9CLOT|nr:hypothetical protein [Clostridium gasigenes]MBB6716533.1 hypothetical protein [Clostridium gasigenes]
MKIYNNISNGNNSGLNLIKNGLKGATGDKAGEAIYAAVNVIDLALNIPHMVKGLVKGGQSIINSGSSIKNFFKKGPMIIGDFKDGASKSIDELVDGIENVISPKREFAGIGKISEKDFNNLSKVDIKPITKNDVQNNYNKIINEGNGINEATDPITKSEYKSLRKKTPTNDIRKMVNPEGTKIDPIYGYKTNVLEADHIVPMKEIVNMPGFSQLSREQQIEVLNLKDNFIGLGKSTNASKGAKNWTDWAGHSKLGEVPSDVRSKMLDLDSSAREALMKAIEERLNK